MLASIDSFGFKGIDGFHVNVEVDVSNGLPAFDIVGLPDASVKESRERVRSALRNSGYQYPPQRVTVNLAPADIRKEGPIYDLPIAMGLLCSSEQINIDNCKQYAFIGELSLNGEIRPINGLLPMAIAAMQQGYKKLVIPSGNVAEAAYIQGIEIYGIDDLKKCEAFASDRLTINPVQPKVWNIANNHSDTYTDFSQIKGQQGAKRAMEIAAAGGHNVLLIGPPGTGKTMLARGLNGILPTLSFDEALEVTKIHSVNGNLNKEEGIIKQRPFRSPHHTVSSSALAGGSSKAVPGEVSLAHYGVLFLDELPEFDRKTLEALRQPLEDGQVTISRVNASATYPARFMLVASMNPCPCGHYGSGDCRCTPPQIQRYLNRISGPLLDRIDLHIEMGPVTYNQLTDKTDEEASGIIRERVNNTRDKQIDRYKQHGIYCNAQLNERLMKKHCELDPQGQAMMKAAFTKMGLSARAYGRILKVSRTIADLSGSENIRAEHIAEAIQYRSLDRKYWGM